MNDDTRRFIVNQFNDLRAHINKIGCDIIERLSEDE